MKKYLGVVLILCLFSLVGCSARELEFDRHYPDTSKLEAMKQAQENTKGSDEQIARFLQLKPKPRDFSMLDSNKRGIMLYPTKYCWSTTITDCENYEPKHPYEDQNNRLLGLTLKANSETIVTINSEESDVPFPNVIEIYTYDIDKNLVLYDSVEMGTYDFKFTLPKESGTHLFIFKALFTEEKIQGVAFYAAEIVVE